MKKSFITTTVATAAIAATALATVATSGAQAATQSASGSGLDRAVAAAKAHGAAFGLDQDQASHPQRRHRQGRHDARPVRPHVQGPARRRRRPRRPHRRGRRLEGRQRRVERRPRRIHDPDRRRRESRCHGGPNGRLHRQHLEADPRRLRDERPRPPRVEDAGRRRRLARRAGRHGRLRGRALRRGRRPLGDRDQRRRHGQQPLPRHGDGADHAQRRQLQPDRRHARLAPAPTTATTCLRRPPAAPPLFTDADNVWGTAPGQPATVAVDARLRRRATWDFYKNTFGRNGIKTTARA